jgi:nicotinate-nucleotide pyrophosphorylase (carboxylating)
LPDIDVRELLFAGVADHKVTAAVVADDPGVAAEVEAAAALAADLGLTVTAAMASGDDVVPGDALLTFAGPPAAVAQGEERLIGTMAKPSGIATAARSFTRRASPGLRVVAGAWKKVAPAQKEVTRAAVAAGGAEVRICPLPFVYLDKNHVTMLGGVAAAVAAAGALPGRRRVVQLGGSPDIAADAEAAVRAGADVVFVDTGRRDDVAAVSAHLRRAGLRGAVELAFAGNVRLADLDALCHLDLDVVDVGRAVVDAPLLDMHLAIVELAR